MYAVIAVLLWHNELLPSYSRTHGVVMKSTLSMALYICMNNEADHMSHMKRMGKQFDNLNIC